MALHQPDFFYSTFPMKTDGIPVQHIYVVAQMEIEYLYHK